MCAVVKSHDFVIEHPVGKGVAGQFGHRLVEAEIGAKINRVGKHHVVIVADNRRRGIVTVLQDHLQCSVQVRVKSRHVQHVVVGRTEDVDFQHTEGGLSEVAGHGHDVARGGVGLADAQKAAILVQRPVELIDVLQCSARETKPRSGFGQVDVVALQVERSRAAQAVLRRNLASLGLEGGDEVRVLRADAAVAVRRLARTGERFDRVFADPPYAGEERERILEVLVETGLLDPAGEIVMETATRNPVAPPRGLALCDERRYGETLIARFRPEIETDPQPEFEAPRSR